MAKVLQHRRGTATEHSNFVGAEGEFTYDTSEKRIVAHDGATKGGIPLAKKAELDSTKSELEGKIEQVSSSLDPRILDAASQSDVLEAVSQATVGNVDAPTLEGLQAQIAANASNIASIPVPVRYVVEKWSSGANWYTKYSDGWIEQGGYAEGITSLSFPLEFSNNKYVFIALPDVIDSGNAVWGVRVYDGQKTTTGITSLITAGSNAGWTGTQNFKGSWVAKGY